MDNNVAESMLWLVVLSPFLYVGFSVACRLIVSEEKRKNDPEKWDINYEWKPKEGVSYDGPLKFESQECARCKSTNTYTSTTCKRHLIANDE